MATILLQAVGLKKYFEVGRSFSRRGRALVRAVDGVSLVIRPGESLGIAGESGCGKTTLGRTLLRLYEPTAGQIVFQEQELTGIDSEAMRRLRRQMQIIFQDPYSSLNPRLTVGAMLAEPLRVHRVGHRQERRGRILQILAKVGLPQDSLNKYPHQFSGGQRQRLCIARALILQPSFIVADEPVSALDMSIQAQICNLMRDLQQEFGFSYLFISHDLAVIKYMSDRVAIMYLGKLVESADASSLFQNPLHPYTRALLAACPIPDPAASVASAVVEGDPPSPTYPPPGCRFHPRCPHRKPQCQEVEPPLQQVERGHEVACHLYGV